MISNEQLVTKFAMFTHKINEARRREEDTTELRRNRDVIRREILRRMKG